MLLSYGIDEDNIKICATTGLVVDIKGLADAIPNEEDKINVIALRADMDGLPIPESNEGLPYRSQTKFAHMCGHDGHMANVVLVAEVLIKNKTKIPKNKTIRLLF